MKFQVIKHTPVFLFGNIHEAVGLSMKDISGEEAGIWFGSGVGVGIGVFATWSDEALIARAACTAPNANSTPTSSIIAIKLMRIE